MGFRCLFLTENKLIIISFNDIISFTKMVKGDISVKINFGNEKRFLFDRMIKIPIIENCEWIGDVAGGFRILFQFDSGIEKAAQVMVYENITPKTMQAAASVIKGNSDGRYGIIMAPYISEKSEQVCIQNGLGYVDLSGNMYLSIGTVYISEKGNPNKFPKKKSSKHIFNYSSTITALILRKLLEDTNKVWKLQYLAKSVGCSIGMVSRIKDKLCEQLWAEMTSVGLKIVDSRGLLEAWSQEYKLPADRMVGCYTLETLVGFEERIGKLRKAHGIDSCLTGLSGGARYAPVVRYNRIHVLVSHEDIEEFIQFGGCKRVDSGANVIIIEARQDQMAGAKEIRGDLVASPVQVFLDCMQLKGRGKEMADAIYEKEIGN